MTDSDKNAAPEKGQENNTEKIQTLREMIYSAEKTLQGAKAMLLQLEGKKKVGRKRKLSEEEGGKVIEGTFDGQIMIGMDGKQYPVPANYASKSKLVEGDILKLTITADGSFIYKQIGPAERKRLLGIANQDADGNYFIIADGKPYRVLLASITYFKVEPGDEVTLVVPRDINSDWGSIENVIQKGKVSADSHSGKRKKAEEVAGAEEPAEETGAPNHHLSVIDEWAPDFEELKKELNKSEE
ncbi:MAG: hypothetical protein AAB487_02025 [Patescibacteria group bacterium]